MKPLDPTRDLRLPRKSDTGLAIPWDTESAVEHLRSLGIDDSRRTVERQLESASWLPPPIALEEVTDEDGRLLKGAVRDSIIESAHRKRHLHLVVQYHADATGFTCLYANDGRMGHRWIPRSEHGAITADELRDVLDAFSVHAKKSIVVWPHGPIMATARTLVSNEGTHAITLPSGGKALIASFAAHPRLTLSPSSKSLTRSQAMNLDTKTLSHLDRLESESMHIMREVAAQADNPVMLYSVGKDSAVMLHIAQKAFAPSVPPFPLMHVDTRWKFQEMYQLREEMARQSGMQLIVHINPDGVAQDINPLDHGSALHTDIMKTQGLKQALDLHRFDAAFGGARRDEEKSRAKERVFSFRNENHRWDPKTQRPELWRLYNARHHPGESMRVFPLSNWTELDIWHYIYREHIPVVPLYFAAERPVVERDGMLLLVDDDRLTIAKDEVIQLKCVRFRTLGCYPLSGAIESDAADLPAILLELLQARTSERQGRLIDMDSANSMEKKKQEGYF